MAFEAIEDALRAAVFEHFAEAGRPLSGPAGLNTLETNSGHVPRRGRPLVDLLAARGLASLHGARVIDLGCGFGALALYLASLGATVTAVDIGAARLEVGASVAERFGLPVSFAVADLRAGLTLETAAFDVAVQNNSLCYLVDDADRRTALTSTHRALAAGGYLVVRDPNRWHPLDPFTGLPLLAALTPTQAAAVATRLGRPRSLVRLRSPRSAARELRSAGFADVQVARPPGRMTPATALARYQHLTARRS